MSRPVPPVRRNLFAMGVSVAFHGAALGLIAVMTGQPVVAPEPMTEMTASILSPTPLPPMPKLAPQPTPKPEVAPPKPAPTLVSKAVDSSPPVNATAAPAPTPPGPVVEKAAPVAAPSAPRFDAAYLNNPAPPYPPLSRRMAEQGKVLLHVMVGADGLAKEVTVAKSSGFPRLDEAARVAVEKWRFVPAKQGDQPIAAAVNVPINFKLD